MNDFSHRDSRTYRSIWRSFGMIGGGVLGAAVVVMLAPPGGWGFLGVAGLLAGGAAYLFWSSRLLSDYSRELRSYRDGSGTRTFARPEAASRVGLEREIDRPSERSPRSRPRRPVDPGLEFPDLPHDGRS